MMKPTENETWIIEKGDEIIQKKVANGIESLSDWERLVYCLWVADYGIRNAGDLDSARDIYADFKADGLKLARILHFNKTAALFVLESTEFIRQYDHLFEAACEELKIQG